MDRMKYGFIFILMLTVSIVLASCSSHPEKTPQSFALEFRYGVGAKSVLDTFNGTYTKDMVVDEPITIKFGLTDKQLEQIHQKVVAIDFFDYPEEFKPKSNIYDTPHETFYFRVRADGQDKQLRWVEENISDEPEAKRLKELVVLIRGMIENSEEFKKLPQARGGYN